MNTVSRPDGLKEKRAELTLARLHPLGAEAVPPTGASGTGSGPASSTPAPGRTPAPAPVRGGRAAAPAVAEAAAAPAGPPVWNTSPLVPDDGIVGDDDIPF
ncbi:MAG: single-stranded DNA-binding protein, partial [Cyanobium sp.]